MRESGISSLVFKVVQKFGMMFTHGKKLVEDGRSASAQMQVFKLSTWSLNVFSIQTFFGFLSLLEVLNCLINLVAGGWIKISSNDNAKADESY